ncbi:MAG: hypothetical protein AB3N33_10515 [Puniceicoccaceae bacterium]
MPEVPELYVPLLYGGAGIVGLVSCFFGYKLFKGLVVALMALSGAALLAWVGFNIGDEPVLWSAGGFLLGAILGGVLALFFYSLAVGTIAALFVATSLLPWVQPYEPVIQWSVIGVACLFAALVATALTNVMIQLASAMLGALLLVHSALFFVTGQTVHQAAEREEGWILYLDFDLKVAGIALAIGLLGFLVQHRSSK